MAGILDFFSPDGQIRRAALDQLGRSAEYYVPPELRQLLGFAAEMSPTAANDRAAQAGGRMMAPGRTPMQRVGDLGGMLSETAGVAAPMAVAGRAGMPVAQAVQEGLLGFSMGADDVGRKFVERMNQPGPVPTMYSNPINFRGQSKLPTQDVFAAAPSQPDRSIRAQADTLIESGEFDKLPSQRVSVAQITPTQRFLGRENMERVAGTDQDTGALLLKQGDQYFVLDGHHRIAENISKGRDSINARVFELPTESTPSGLLSNPEQMAKPTPPARALNPAEQMAKDILDLRAAGRAGEVTEEMMAQADPQYMFANTPLPMDEASRMVRAAGQGYDLMRPMYHGTDTDFTSVNTDIGSGERYKTGFFSSDNPDVAASYAPNRDLGRILPIMSRAADRGVVLDAQGANWNRIDAASPARDSGSVLANEFPELSGDQNAYSYFSRMYDDLMGLRELSTNAMARERRFEGDPSITFKNVVDRGPYSLTNEQALSASQPSTVAVDFYPSKIRSRFARFDPEFRHLRNLSAGVGGLGLLSTIPSQEEQY